MNIVSFYFCKHFSRYLPHVLMAALKECCRFVAVEIDVCE